MEPKSNSIVGQTACAKSHFTREVVVEVASYFQNFTNECRNVVRVLLCMVVPIIVVTLDYLWHCRRSPTSAWNVFLFKLVHLCRSSYINNRTLTPPSQFLRNLQKTVTMFKLLSVVPILFCVVSAAPKLRIVPSQSPPQLLTLPSNATSIRLDISDSFSCEGRAYGYYADVENDCQLFHVCLPITYNDGRNQTFRWSFICPEDTVFSQEIFTCTRADEAIDCNESPRFYELNSNFGSEEAADEDLEDATAVPAEVPQLLSTLRRINHRN